MTASGGVCINLPAVQSRTMRDDASGGDQRARRKKLATNNGLQRLGQVVGVNGGIYSAELTGCREALQATRLRLVLPSQHECHVANLRVKKVEAAVRVAILHINRPICRKPTHRESSSASSGCWGTIRADDLR
jgi:hypothetical protein